MVKAATLVFLPAPTRAWGVSADLSDVSPAEDAPKPTHHATEHRSSLSPLGRVRVAALPQPRTGDWCSLARPGGSAERPPNTKISCEGRAILAVADLWA